MKEFASLEILLNDPIDSESFELGECLGYIDDPCPNCGRIRVEKWSCGKHICEKCHWCIEDETYYNDY